VAESGGFFCLRIFIVFAGSFEKNVVVVRGFLMVELW
jgi:hypothetical protein